MTNEQFAVYLQQLKSKIDTMYDSMWETLEQDEKYMEIGKSILGPVTYVPMLKPLGDLQSELDEALDLLKGSKQS